LNRSRNLVSEGLDTGSNMGMELKLIE
jgi:hypothetical protein